MDIKKVIETLSPNERKIMSYLGERKISEICKKSNLDRVSVLRSLRYLENKKIVKLSTKKKKIVEIGLNGALYKKKGLPERRLLNLLNEKRILNFKEAQEQSKLSDDEFRASLGVLKRKSMIELRNGKIILSANREEISKKMSEESFIDSLPRAYDNLTKEELAILRFLENRRDIIQIKYKKIIDFQITDFGRRVTNSKIKIQGLIEKINQEILKKESWKGKKFRRYDVTSKVPEISGGKKHFVNQAIDYARKIWLEMGFKEMTGDLIQSSFWNFDALFTPQDHPARDLQDTFFINRKININERRIMEAVKEAHETGVGKGQEKSKGWQYSWNEEEAKRLVLRTHTTCLSAETLSKLKLEDLPAKFFAVGKCFRNETVDWSHSFEFNQTEGIVVDENANFRHLLGYLKEFAKKMGFEKVRFRPHYFPYTEPSIEGDVWNEKRKKWIEVFAAGIFRPEVTLPLLGKPIPVLAWGPGFDRMIMQIFKIRDMRELYKNNLNQLRKLKCLMK